MRQRRSGVEAPAHGPLTSFLRGSLVARRGLEGEERPGRVRRALEPPKWILLEEPLDPASDAFRQGEERPEARRRLAELSLEDLVTVLEPEGRRAGGERVNETAQRVKVRPRPLIGDLPPHLLGGHERR